MKFLVQLAGMTLDAVLPPHCATCDAEVAGIGSLCAACFSATNFITAPLCDGCGLPFPNSLPQAPNRVCDMCAAQPPSLAHILARMSLVPTVPDALRRTRHTPSLGNLSAAQRAQAVAGVFAINPRRHARVRGKAILLIDDVLTSGATAAACTTALLDAGARHVDLLVASRVADPRRQP